MKKFALFVFNGDPMCFIHVLLNAIDMSEKGYEAKIIIEGAATKLILELEKKGNPLHQLWKRARAKGLVEGVCKACANKMETNSGAKTIGLPPSGGRARTPGHSPIPGCGFWRIITF